MGICYQIHMRDDFDWEYVGKSKKDKLNQFCEDIEKLNRARPKLIAEWYGHAIFDMHKTSPNIKEYGEIILKYCDECHYWSDCGNPGISELNKENLY